MTRQALIQIIGRAEGELRGLDDLVDTTATLNRLGGSLFAAVTAAFKDIGIEPTERGAGLGEWDCGAVIDTADIAKIMTVLQDRFRAAFASAMLRWSCSILDDKTVFDVFPGETAAGVSTTTHPAETGRSYCRQCGCAVMASGETICSSCTKPLEMEARRADILARAVAKALCPPRPEELGDIRAPADAEPAEIIEAFLAHRRADIIGLQATPRSSTPPR